MSWSVSRSCIQSFRSEEQYEITRKRSTIHKQSQITWKRTWDKLTLTMCCLHPTYKECPRSSCDSYQITSKCFACPVSDYCFNGQGHHININISFNATKNFSSMHKIGNSLKSLEKQQQERLIELIAEWWLTHYNSHLSVMMLQVSPILKQGRVNRQASVQTNNQT